MNRLQSILFASDFRDSSNKAADAVIRLATTFDAAVTGLHVREEFLTWPISPFENQDRLVERLRGAGVNLTEFAMRAGSPTELITSKARELDVDLLVIGAGERIRDGHAVLGPVAEAIIDHSPGPILVVNPHGPELQFRSILCPVDNSAVARRGLQDAISLARVFAGKLTVLCVVPKVSWFEAAVETGEPEKALSEHEAKWQREFQDFLQDFSFDGLEVRVEVRHGLPHEEIVAAAQAFGADLLVMGATGRTGLVRLLLGSTTRRVLRQLPCSILLVKDHVAFEEDFLLDLDAIDDLTSEGRKALRQQAYAEAAGKFRRALALDPFHPDALSGLIEAGEKLGDSETVSRYRRRIERIRR